MAHVFDLHATPRHHLYFAGFLLFLGWPIVALAWFMAYFLFFWDEFKCEYLDYDEYFEDCLEMFRITLDDVERVYRATAFLEDYYKDKTYPEDLMIRESAQTAGASSDYDFQRKSTEWDSMDLYHVQWTLDWVLDDWLYEAEIEVDEQCDLHLEDIEQYYMFLNTNRKNYAHIPNRHLTANREYAPHTLLASSTALTKNSVSLLASRSDVSSFLGYKNDFRFRYWNRSLKKDKFFTKL